MYFIIIFIKALMQADTYECVCGYQCDFVLNQERALEEEEEEEEEKRLEVSSHQKETFCSSRSCKWSHISLTLPMSLCCTEGKK